MAERAHRAATLSGRFQAVTLGGNSSKVLGAGNYTITGVTRRTVDVSEFGVDVDIFEFDSADGGTISLTNVSYDPANADQNTLRTVIENAIKLEHSSTSGIRFWINSTSFLTVGTSGHILLTKAGDVTTDRNAIARTSFEGQVSGAFMYIAATIV